MDGLVEPSPLPIFALKTDVQPISGLPIRRAPQLAEVFSKVPFGRFKGTLVVVPGSYPFELPAK